MDPKELLDLLNLNGRAGPPKEPALIVSAPESAPTEAASPTALEIDAWGIRRGHDLLAESERIRALDLDSDTVADCHAAAFDPEPRTVPFCRDRLRRDFFATLLETPEFRALHESTHLDPVASEIAATHIAEQWAQFRKESSVTAGSDPLSQEVATLRAVNRAVIAARDEVTECREALSALGMGPGCPGSNDPKAIAELFRRVRGDPTLRRICALAGRYRRLAMSRQRRKTRHGLDDVVGVELGGDLGKVLPHELARLAVPELEIDVLRRLVERQLMCREYHATEPVGKGPIIVCIDESGSMEGDLIHTAKAVALALAWVARQQRRWSALVAYSGDSGQRLLALPPGRWDEQALASWLMEFIGRGSSLDVPVREMPRIYEALQAPRGDTDVIFLTDCRCSIPESARDAFQAWKQTVQAKLITLVIGDEPGDLVHVSDEVHLVRSLDIGESAVERVLSI